MKRPISEVTAHLDFGAQPPPAKKQPAGEDNWPEPAPSTVDDGAWLSDWCEEHGSCLDVWGSPEVQAKLKTLVDQGASVRVFSFVTDDGPLAAQAKMVQQRFRKRGYQTLAFEDNIDQGELIMFKPTKDGYSAAARKAMGWRESRASKLIKRLLDSDGAPSSSEDGCAWELDAGGENFKRYKCMCLGTKVTKHERGGQTVGFRVNGGPLLKSWEEVTRQLGDTNWRWKRMNPARG